MNSLTRTTLWAACAATLLLAGCASSVKLDEGPKVEDRSPTPVDGGKTVGAGDSGGGTAPGAPGGGTGVPQPSVAQVDLNKGGNAAATSGRIVYFDFDSFVVKDEFRGLVDGHARALVANKAKRMVIEGHTDERGGREYNLALGQKRADAVAKSMQLLGAGPAQVEAVSFGKERPAVEGQDEAAWAKNRRAELKDR